MEWFENGQPEKRYTYRYDKNTDTGPSGIIMDYYLQKAVTLMEKSMVHGQPGIEQDKKKKLSTIKMVGGMERLKGGF